MLLLFLRILILFHQVDLSTIVRQYHNQKWNLKLTITTKGANDE